LKRPGYEIIDPQVLGRFCHYCKMMYINYFLGGESDLI